MTKEMKNKVEKLVKKKRDCFAALAVATSLPNNFYFLNLPSAGKLKISNKSLSVKYFF
jgi:hypothetical protein